MIKVKLYGHIRGLIGEELKLDREELRVKELLEIVVRSGGHGFQLNHENTLVAVNGVEVSALDGWDTIVRSGDEVSLIPVTHGG